MARQREESRWRLPRNLTCPFAMQESASNSTTSSFSIRNNTSAVCLLNPLPETTATANETLANWSEADARMMTRALELAAKGVGQVSPGPLVGCVIVGPNGETVGEGFYIYDHLKHAETLALEQAGSRALGATAYVSLEPHAHHGRTPPCSNALIEAGIKRVVAPIEDPNPEVSGKGFEHLRSAGV